MAWGKHVVKYPQHSALMTQQHSTGFTVGPVLQSLTWPANPHGLKIADTHQSADQTPSADLQAQEPRHQNDMQGVEVRILSWQNGLQG